MIYIKQTKIIVLSIIISFMCCKFPHHTPIDVHATLYLTINNNLDDTVVIQYSIRHYIDQNRYKIQYNSEEFSIANQSSIEDTITYDYEHRDPCLFWGFWAQGLPIDVKILIKDTLYSEVAVFPWDTTYGYRETYPDDNCNKFTWDTLNIN